MNDHQTTNSRAVQMLANVRIRMRRPAPLGEWRASVASEIRSEVELLNEIKLIDAEKNAGQPRIRTFCHSHVLGNN